MLSDIQLALEIFLLSIALLIYFIPLELFEMKYEFHLQMDLRFCQSLKISNFTLSLFV